MGVNIVVITEHTSHPSPMSEMIELLTPALESIRTHMPVWRKWGIPNPRDTPICWQFDGEFDYDEMAVCEISEPYGVRLEIGPRFCMIYPSPRWDAFIDDPGIQTAVTEFCAAVASCIGGDKLLYIPDSAYRPAAAHDFIYQDISLEAILEWLAEECGAPSPTISAISTELTDEEMLKLVPNWNGDTDARYCNADGYHVAMLA